MVSKVIRSQNIGLPNDHQVITKTLHRFSTAITFTIASQPSSSTLSLLVAMYPWKFSNLCRILLGHGYGTWRFMGLNKYGYKYLTWGYKYLEVWLPYL